MGGWGHGWRKRTNNVILPINKGKVSFLYACSIISPLSKSFYHQQQVTEEHLLLILNITYNTKSKLKHDFYFIFSIFTLHPCETSK